MTYRELLELYKQGKLEEKKRKEVEEEIEKQEAISDYLFREEGIPGLDELENMSAYPESGEEDDMEARFVKMVNSSIRRAFLKMGAAVGAVVLAVVLAVIFILPKAVSVFYYDPGKVVAKTALGDSVNTTNQMSRDMAVYTELLVPGYGRDNVIVDDRGYGNYDICISQSISYGQNFSRRFYNVSGKIEKGKLTLYDTNYFVPMAGNQFDWFQRENADLSLRELDEKEKQDMELGENEYLVHGAALKEDMKENLAKMNDNEYYLAYITLNEMMEYEDFIKFYQQQEDLGYGWCAVKVNDSADFPDGQSFRPENLGFYCDLVFGTSCGWDKEKYSNLLLWENMEEGSFQKCEKGLQKEAFVKEHFISLLRYMADQKAFCKMMNADQDFSGAAEYVEKNGVKVYGFAAVVDKEALMKLSEMEEVYVIDAEEYR